MINERIKTIRKVLKLSQTDMAKNLETSSGYISEIETGKITPGGAFMQKIHERYNVNINWLLSGKGGMFVDLTGIDDIGETTGLMNQNKVGAAYSRRTKNAESTDLLTGVQGFVSIPLYHVNGSAGTGIEAPEIEEKDVIAINEIWIKRVLSVSPASLSVITVSGDSMEPTLRNGDLIIVDMSQNLPTTHGVYVVRKDTEILVKRVQLRNDTAVLYSDNNLYRDIEVNLQCSNFSIIGKVVGFLRKM